MSQSELAWKLSDYQAAGIEPPPRCVSNPELSEGEMMSADEVEEFIKDSIATLRILSDKKHLHFVMKDGMVVASHADHDLPREVFARRYLSIDK